MTAKTLPPVVDPETKKRQFIWLSVLDAARVFVLNPTPDHALMLRAEASVFYNNLNVWVTESASEPITVSPKELIDSNNWILIGWKYHFGRKSIVRERIDLSTAPAFAINRAEKDIRSMGDRDPLDLLMAAAVDQAMYNPHGLKYSFTQLELIDRMKAKEMEMELSQEPIRV